MAVSQSSMALPKSSSMMKAWAPRGSGAGGRLTVRIVDCVAIIELNCTSVELDGLFVVAFHLLFIAKILSH